MQSQNEETVQMYERLNIPYYLSRDYGRLHDLLAVRNEIVCFVDYTFAGSDMKPCRDVCTARCFADDDYIRISSRGIQYNNPCDSLSERVKFLADCESMNLEFIDPADQLR